MYAHFLTITVCRWWWYVHWNYAQKARYTNHSKWQIHNVRQIGPTRKVKLRHSTNCDIVSRMCECAVLKWLQHLLVIAAAKREAEASGQSRCLCNGPGISQSDRFIKKCTELFLKLFRSPLVSKSKYKWSSVIDRLMKRVSTFVWSKTWKEMKISKPLSH